MWLVGGVVKRYIDILIIIITFPSSGCNRFFLAAASLLLCSFFMGFFRSCSCYFCAIIYIKRRSKNISDRSKIEITQTWQYN